jgi:hypothetical protein
MGWVDRAPKRTLRFWVQCTEVAWTMARTATDQVTTTGIDIGKNTFHVISLDGCSGSDSEVWNTLDDFRLLSRSGRDRLKSGL